jgi:Lrp/AsnC family leucine-responsive transcriptional regulator
MKGLDATDQEILNLLQTNAKISQAEIGRRVGLSAASVNERIKKLESSGVIRKVVALIDDEKVGCAITAFVEVFLEHPRFEPGFLEVMKSLDEIQEVHHITGEFTCLLKIKVATRDTLRQLLLDRIAVLEGVGRTRTAVVLSTHKEEPRVLIP